MTIAQTQPWMKRGNGSGSYEVANKRLTCVRLFPVVLHLTSCMSRVSLENGLEYYRNHPTSILSGLPYIEHAVLWQLQGWIHPNMTWRACQCQCVCLREHVCARLKQMVSLLLKRWGGGGFGNVTMLASVLTVTKQQSSQGHFWQDNLVNGLSFM